MAKKLLSFACARNETVNGEEEEEEEKLEGSQMKALFMVSGMTCSACAASVENSIKRLPGIKEAAVDFLNNRSQVVFFPSFVTEETIRETIEGMGFEAKLIKEEGMEVSNKVCRIQIKGMTCTSCSSTIESSLRTTPGVHRANVALTTEEAEVHYDPKISNCDQLLNAIKDSGFEAKLISTGEDRNKIHLKIDGLGSGNSMRLVLNSLQALPGVEDVSIHPELQKVTLSYEADVTGPRNFIRVIESAGPGRFKAMIYPDDAKGAYRQEEIKQYGRSFLWSLIFSIPVFLTSMVFMYIPALKDVLDTKVRNMATFGEILRWVLATPVQFIIGQRFYTGSYNALRHGSANMDVLIALGTNAAYFYSVYSVLRAITSPTFSSTDFFETSSMLISFILLGKYLEILAKGKTSEAIVKLMDLTPKTATLLTFDVEGNVMTEEEIDSRLIQRNDALKIIPGEKVACDGLVTWGQSHVNESMITGESQPVAKHKGDIVIGGTVNENGILHIRATKVGSGTALSQIVRLVELAQMAKAPVQKLADRISKFFVPLVCDSKFLAYASC